MENSITDKLAEKTEKVKVLNVKHKHELEKLASMTNENAVIKGFVSNVNMFLRKMVESTDSNLSATIRTQITINLHPVFNMLNQIIGVSESGSPSKQGGDKDDKLKIPKAPETTKSADETDQKKIFDWFKHTTGGEPFGVNVFRYKFCNLRSQHTLTE
ncbi:hypothetical protein L1887_02792 [Cichorium endivia]|nr:hypothetical protein L1887_02792 [Cichorium endivia]